MAKPKSSYVNKSSARLQAVQLAYAMLMDETSARDCLRDHRDEANDMSKDTEFPVLAAPDAELLTSIVGGIERRRGDIVRLIAANLEPLQQNQIDNEPLLKSILMCAVYELLENTAIDPPIIINEYLNVTSAFYETNEKKLVNALIDKINKSLAT